MIRYFILFLFITPLLFAQTVYEPLHNDVYAFLSRLSQKGVIQLDDNIKPLSRMYIAGQLKSIAALAGSRYGGIKGKVQSTEYKVQSSKDKVERSEIPIYRDTKLDEIQLTDLEIEELEFYLKDFTAELQLIFQSKPKNSLDNEASEKKNVSDMTLASFDPEGRWRLFGYSDDLFKINVNPILGYETGKSDGEKNTHTWSGIGFYGYLMDYIGFSFSYRDNSEKGKGIDASKSFSKETGVVISRRTGDKIEYSEVRTSLSGDWSWGSVSVGKDFLEWGYGESGKLVLSQKAPSFPFIRLDIKPVDWLSFNYVHAWLSSDVVDSSEIYPTKSIQAGANRIIYRDKYFASHTFNIFPVDGLSISLGESVIYSDKLEVSYLMPLMFFRLADHYLSKNNNSAGSNSQFFFGVSSRNHVKNTHLYGTLFIDEVTLSGLFDSQKQRNQLGFTLGGSVADLPIDNLTITTEYTKIYPFVYTHYIPTQTYENASYQLGHWMGHNSDLMYGSLNYRILRGLQVSLWGEYIRKGEDGVIDQQYTQPQPPFLFGLDTKYLYTGIEIKYEIIHDLFFRGQYQYNKASKEQVDGSILKSNFNEVSFALYYRL